MPTYEYRCKSCSHKFERFQKMTEAAIRVCPQCRRKTVERLLSGGAGMIFKGSGFYQTDYRSKGYQEAAKKDSPQKDTPKDSSSKSDSSCGPS